LQSSAQSPRDGAAGPLKLELSRALAEGPRGLKARLKILKSPSRACKPRHWKSGLWTRDPGKQTGWQRIQEQWENEGRDNNGTGGMFFSFFVFR